MILLKHEMQSACTGLRGHSLNLQHNKEMFHGPVEFPPYHCERVGGGAHGPNIQHNHVRYHERI